MFTKTQFISSAAKVDQFPDLVGLNGKRLPEIACVGRSNVGKSSLINHLTRNKKLARISSTPGKTQLINFFEVDQKLCLVDLPGYGFAKVAKQKKAAWSPLIEGYLESRKTLSLILLLCDIRHPPSLDDMAFAKWASHYGHPLVVVFTKADKLSPHIVKTHCEKNSHLLLDGIGDKRLSADSCTTTNSLERDREVTRFKPIVCIPHSIKDGKGRALLIKTVENYL